MGFADRFRQLGKLARPPKGPGRYEFEPVSWKVSRRLKGVQGPPEDREGMTAFLDGHTGVEAYVEPKTVMHPLSVVLVAGDGEHKRFELSDDAFLRELVAARNIRVLDAGRVGYPQRMRDYLARQKREGG
ncbi:MAG: oxidoreductase [Actinomycetota bacterium]